MKLLVKGALMKEPFVVVFLNLLQETLENLSREWHSTQIDYEDLKETVEKKTSEKKEFRFWQKSNSGRLQLIRKVEKLNSWAPHELKLVISCMMT